MFRGICKRDYKKNPNGAGVGTYAWLEKMNVECIKKWGLTTDYKIFMSAYLKVTGQKYTGNFKDVDLTKKMPLRDFLKAINKVNEADAMK